MAIDKKKILDEPFGIVKTATLRTFLQCADYMLSKNNKSVRVSDLTESGASIFMASEFINFGLDFGFIKAQEGLRRRQQIYTLSKTGLQFYRAIIEWEEKLRKQ